jgi:uroporphyrin-III C-methyltransferase
VIPGVTAALAASAGALAPLTHRGAAQAVTFVTAHGAGGETPQLDWTALARANQSVVIYMGLTKAAEIAARLIAAGRDAATPALIVENASLPTERRILTTLSGLGAAAEGLSGPALLIVGEAMALAEPVTPSTALASAKPELRFGEAGSRSPSPLGGGEALAFSPPSGGRAGEAGRGVSVPHRRGVNTPHRRGAA